MQPSGAAKAHQREKPRVLSSLNRNDPERSFHVCIGDANYSKCRVFGGDRLFREARHLSPESRKNRARAVYVDRHFTSEQICSAESSKHEIGIGDGCFLAAPVTRRAGICARRLRAYAQSACGIDPRH